MFSNAFVGPSNLSFLPCQAASGDDVLARVGVESLAPEGGSYSWELPMQRLGKLFVAEMAVRFFAETR
jgi:hypothetical protein